MAQTLFKAHPSACRGWVVYSLTKSVVSEAVDQLLEEHPELKAKLSDSRKSFKERLDEKLKEARTS